MARLKCGFADIFPRPRNAPMLTETHLDHIRAVQKIESGSLKV